MLNNVFNAQRLIDDPLAFMLLPELNKNWSALHLPTLKWVYII